MFSLIWTTKKEFSDKNLLTSSMNFNRKKINSKLPTLFTNRKYIFWNEQNKKSLLVLLVRQRIWLKSRWRLETTFVKRKKLRRIIDAELKVCRTRDQKCRLQCLSKQKFTEDFNLIWITRLSGHHFQTPMLWRLIATLSHLKGARVSKNKLTIQLNLTLEWDR